MKDLLKEKRKHRAKYIINKTNKTENNITHKQIQKKTKKCKKTQRKTKANKTKHQV